MFSGNLREATRSLHVSYPVPFIAALLLICGLCFAGLARFFDPAGQVFLLSLAGGLCLLAGAIVVRAVFFSPSLLRSERYEFLDRMMAVVGDSDMDQAARERLQAKLIRSVAERHSERPGYLGAEDDAEKRRPAIDE